MVKQYLLMVDILFLNKLNHQEIETIHSREATLDDIFIQVTGKSLDA